MLLCWMFITRPPGWGLDWWYTGVYTPGTNNYTPPNAACAPPPYQNALDQYGPAALWAWCPCSTTPCPQTFPSSALEGCPSVPTRANGPGQWNLLTWWGNVTEAIIGPPAIVGNYYGEVVGQNWCQPPSCYACLPGNSCTFNSVTIPAITNWDGLSFPAVVIPLTYKADGGAGPNWEWDGGPVAQTSLDGSVTNTWYVQLICQSTEWPPGAPWTPGYSLWLGVTSADLPVAQWAAVYWQILPSQCANECLPTGPYPVPAGFDLPAWNLTLA